MKKAVIFDMDGTLVDSEPAITFAAMEVIRRLGYEAKEEEFKPFTGMGDDKFIGGVLESHGGVYQPAYKEEAYRIYCETAKNTVKVYPWSKAIIEALHAMGYRLAVASASDLIKVTCNLNCIGVDLSLFDAIVTGSDVTKKKPAPDIFLKAAEKLGVRMRPLDLKSAKRVLSGNRLSDGFNELKAKGQLKLSLEALSVDKRFTDLFTDEEANEALMRLLEVGYHF
jgi:phosphoglycolate phosphatase